MAWSRNGAAGELWGSYDARVMSTGPGASLGRASPVARRSHAPEEIVALLVLEKPIRAQEESIESEETV